MYIMYVHEYKVKSSNISTTHHVAGKGKLRAATDITQRNSIVAIAEFNGLILQQSSSIISLIQCSVMYT